MNTHRILLPLLAVLLLGAVLPAADTARAQGGGEQLDEFIGRTGEVLQWAAEIVQNSDSQRARRMLEEARRLHERSLAMADQGRGVMALRMSERARRGAQQAARLGNMAQNLQERARLRLERFRDVLEQVGDAARESGDERAMVFVEEAEGQARRAFDQLRQGNFEMALQLLDPAESMLSRAARLVFEGGGAERLERETERVSEFIARVAERLEAEGGDTETARDLLASARGALDRSRQAAAEGEPLRAMQSLRVARRLAAQAADAADGASSPEDFAVQLERWDERAETVAEQVRDSGSRQAEQVLARAREHRERAGRLVDEGEVEQAIRQLRAAFDLLDEARDLSR
jgi:hypothetical protein